MKKLQKIPTNINESIEYSIQLTHAIINKKIGRKVAESANRSEQIVINKILSAMEYNQIHHPDRKIPFMESK